MNEALDFLSKGGGQFFTISVSILALVVSIVAPWRTRRVPLARERLDSIISPLFELTEKYLFVDRPFITTNDITQIIEIVIRGGYLAGGRLRSFIDIGLDEKGHRKRFMRLCQNISKEYDFLCRAIGIPVRPFRYRYVKYGKWFITRFILLYLCTTVLCVIALLGFIALLGKLLNTDTPISERIIYAIIIIVSSLGTIVFIITKLFNTSHKL